MSRPARKTIRWTSIGISVAGLAVAVAMPPMAAAGEITLKRCDVGGAVGCVVAEDGAWTSPPAPSSGD